MGVRLEEAQDEDPPIDLKKAKKQRNLNNPEGSRMPDDKVNGQTNIEESIFVAVYPGRQEEQRTEREKQLKSDWKHQSKEQTENDETGHHYTGADQDNLKAETTTVVYCRKDEDYIPGGPSEDKLHNAPGLAYAGRSSISFPRTSLAFLLGEDSFREEQSPKQIEPRRNSFKSTDVWNCTLPRTPRFAMFLVSRFAMFLVVTLCFGQSVELVQGSTCQTDGAVFQGEQTAITCQFSVNLRDHRLSFSVVRYDFDNLDPLPDLIVSCLWNEDYPSCALIEGYTVKLAASGHTLTIGIPKAQKAHAGRYSCRHQTSQPSKQEECFLAIKGFHVFCTLPTPAAVHIGTATSVTCHYNSDLRETREDFYIYRFLHKEGIPVRVLHCYWDLQETHPICMVETGYMCDRTNVSTTVTLHITSAMKLHSGIYSCRTIPYNKNINVHDCTLDVKETITTTMTSSESALDKRPESVTLHHQISFSEISVTKGDGLLNQGTNQAAKLQCPSSLVVIFLVLTRAYTFEFVASFHSITLAPCRGGMA